LALVAGSLAYLAISEPQGWASAIAIAWVVATCSVGGTRWRALAWVASGLALGIAIRSLDGECDRWCCSRDELTIPAELGLIVALVATSLAAAALSVRRGAPAWDPSGAPRARETIVLALTAVATLVVSFAGNDHPSDPIPLGFPDVSAASASFWVQASLFAAIAVARAFEAPSRSA
jgi:hypothetical protein